MPTRLRTAWGLLGLVAMTQTSTEPLSQRLSAIREQLALLAGYL